MVDYIEKDEKDILLRALKNENEKLKQKNNFLMMRIKNYKILCKLREYAFEIAILKIVDNCKFCKFKRFSTKCQTCSCKSGMKKYFISFAKKNAKLKIKF